MHLVTCGQWLNHWIIFSSLPSLYNINTSHALSIFPVFSPSLRLLSKHHLIFCHPYWVTITTEAGSLVLLNTLLYSSRACGYFYDHTISAGTCAPSITHHNIHFCTPFLHLSSGSFSLWMPGHVTPCSDRKSPFSGVCNLSVSPGLGSKQYAEPLLFAVHLNLRPVATKGRVLAYNFDSTSKRKKVWLRTA